MKQLLFLALTSTLFLGAQAQSGPNVAQDTTYRGGAWARLEVINGDSTFVMSLMPVKIWTRRNFKDLEEQKQYWRYTRAAKIVYPYALQAIGLYEQIQDETEGMNKRKRKRYIKHEHKELKEDMTSRLKNLSKTEGKVLIKMIESQIGKPFYTVIKETRGGATATYWNTLGKIWGYDLKEGYKEGDDPLLDAVFLDYDFGDPMAIYR